MMHALSGSVANIVIFPMQDVLGLSGNHRMNFPSHSTGNWEWRFSWDQLKPSLTQSLLNMAKNHNRASILSMV